MSGGKIKDPAPKPEPSQGAISRIITAFSSFLDYATEGMDGVGYMPEGAFDDNEEVRAIVNQVHQKSKSARDLANQVISAAHKLGDAGKPAIDKAGEAKRKADEADQKAHEYNTIRHAQRGLPLAEEAFDLATEADTLHKAAVEQQRLAEEKSRILHAIKSIIPPPDSTKAEQEKIKQAVTSIQNKLNRALSSQLVEGAEQDRLAAEKLVEDTKATIKNRKEWTERHSIIEPKYNTAKPKLDVAITAKVQEWWDSVTGDKAAKDYAAALEGINQVEAILTQAELTKTAAEFTRSQQKIGVKVLSSTDIKGPQKKLDAAELLLTKLNKLSEGKKNLEDAKTAFEEASNEYKTALKKQAESFESADGGHSLRRHGPDITDELLKRRVEKGLAADDALSPTHSSTKFDKIEDWIETRDKAIIDILAKNGLTPTSVAPAKTSYTGVIEHGRPIDSGFIADKSTAKEVVMMDSLGQPIPELKKGKKRWVRNNKSEPLDENGTVVPYAGGEKNPLDKNGNPVSADNHATAVWPTGQKPPVLRYKTYTVYTGHTKVSGLTRTLTTIESDGTTWKVVQHFPHAEGWDPVQKKYTIPL